MQDNDIVQQKMLLVLLLQNLLNDNEYRLNWNQLSMQFYIHT